MIKFFRRVRQNLLSEGKTGKYLKYALGEIVLVVIGILIALQINNWNEGRKEDNIENKILVEISKGLKQDLIDIQDNMKDHSAGLKACKYYHDIFTNKQVQTDSIKYYYTYLTRSHLSIQNRSGYESLKSRGLEIVKDDSLRSGIIKLYEQDYPFIMKLEEQDPEGNFHNSYFKEISNQISTNLIFNENGEIESIQLPLKITETEQKKMLSYLWKIKNDRTYIMSIYSKVQGNLFNLQSDIERLRAKDLD
jgi:hypothetical protein